MHVATDVRAELLGVRIDDSPAGWTDVFPGWTPHDRFGIVVREPFGALGASLLIQLAALAFYEALPGRREADPQYPQSYLFHVGGAHGDHSNFDFWPARHEVHLADEPYEILGAINDRGITRLAVPERTAQGDSDYVLHAPSGWTDRAAARERLRTAMVYAPRGLVADADVQLESDDPELWRMSTNCLETERSSAYFAGLDDGELLDLEIGPSSVADLRSWTRLFDARRDEIPRALRSELLASSVRRRDRDGARREGYRRVDIEHALRLL